MICERGVFVQKLLTVSVAAYNVEATLAKALESFLQEDVLSRVEVIVVDDGSTDHTPSIAEDYVKQYPDTFHLVRKKNGGYGSTINTSLPIATGRYFRLLDGDDWFNPVEMVRLLDALEACDDDFVLTTGYSEHYDADGTECAVALAIEPGFGLPFDVLRGQHYVGHHRSVFRTGSLRKNWAPLLENCFYTDDQYMLQGFLRAETIAVVDACPYVYRLAFAGQSVSLSGFAAHYREGVRCHIAICEGFYAANIEAGAKRDFLIAFLANHLQGVIGMFLCLAPTRQHKREMREFYNGDREKYPEVYEACRAKKVLLLRWSGFALYRPVGWMWRRRFNKKP